MPDARDLPEITEWWETEGMEKFSTELGTFVTITPLTGACEERDVIAEL
ncbi:MAG: hypothetical protein H6765_05105 [Candidatus Peribacteria bacterium]|nr:MAG: hypothetical protein H6765_05105 [Candidatus Peribacteria bacterium]